MGSEAGSLTSRQYWNDWRPKKSVDWYAMRQSYLVCYDISDDKRLRKVFKTMRGYAGEGFDDSVLCGGVRSVHGVLPSIASWEASARSGFDGAIPAANCGFGGAERSQH